MIDSLKIYRQHILNIPQLGGHFLAFVINHHRQNMVVVYGSYMVMVCLSNFLGSVSVVTIENKESLTKE